MAKISNKSLFGWMDGWKMLYLEKFLDGINGGGEQRVHFLVIVDVVCMTDAHEEDVRWETRYCSRNGVGLHV